MGYMNLAGHREQWEGQEGRGVGETVGGIQDSNPVITLPLLPYILNPSAEQGLCETPRLDLEFIVPMCCHGRVSTESVCVCACVYYCVYVYMLTPPLPPSWGPGVWFSGSSQHVGDIDNHQPH